MKTIKAAVICAGAVCGLLLTGQSAMAQNLFVGAYGTESIVTISPGGTASTFATGLNYPTGLAFDSSGDLFESDQGSGHLYEWVAGSTTGTTFASGMILGQMTFSGAGDLYVVNNGTVIDEFSPAGVILNTITGFTSAQSVAFDGAGNLYVSDSSNGSVTKVTPGGTRSTFASGLNYPVGLAFNASGDLFVAGGNDVDTITEITPDGTPSLFASGLGNPAAIAFDNAGNMFVADENGNDITEFAVNGTRSVFSTSVSTPMSLAFQPVPEPSEYALFGLGLVGLVLGWSKRIATQNRSGTA